MALAVSPGLASAQFNATGSNLSTSSTGGSGGAGTLGSSSSLGSSSLTGSSTTGGGGGTTGARTNTGGGGGGGNNNTTSTPAVPTASNIFNTTYANPFSQGLASSYYPNSGTFGAPNTTAPTFGTPIYTQTNTTATSAAQTTTTAGFSTVGQLRSPVYATGLSKDVPMIEHKDSQIQSKVRAALLRSSYLKNKANIQVVVDGATVVLRGQVASEQEYRAAGALARLEPGVRDVLNELQITGTK